tara:strand:- start:172 stop:456 length:285 start_codon:yes stop_codon:yes gene_type:complete
MNIDVSFDVDTDDIFTEIECQINDAIENKIGDIETPEALLDAYMTVATPCGVGEMFEQAVWKAVTTRLDVEVKRILRGILAPDPTQQEIAVAPV